MKIRRNFNVDLDKYVIMQDISNPEETFVAFKINDFNVINTILKSKDEKELETEKEGHLILYNHHNNTMELNEEQKIQIRIKDLKGIWLLPSIG